MSAELDAEEREAIEMGLESEYDPSCETQTDVYEEETKVSSNPRSRLHSFAPSRAQNS